MIKYRRYTALFLAALVAVSGTAGCAEQNSAAESAASAETAAGNAAAEGDGGQDAGAEESAAADTEYWPVLAVSPGGAQFPDMNIVVPTTEAPPEYIRIGTRSWIVKDLQARLMELGFMDNDEPSEYYGEVTQAAVKIYQRQNHLAQDGIVGAETLAAILDENAHYYTAQHGDSGTDIVELQQRLYQLGYLANSSDITGTFDENTFPSLRRIGNNAMSNQKFAGRLYLPALETVYDWGINGNTPGFTEIVLSPTKNSIYTLGKGCLGWLYNVTNVVIGLSPTNRLSDQAFSGNTKMTRVEFTGSPPNFTSDAANVFTGPGALGITFIAPDTSAWQAFLKPFETSGDFVRWSNESIRAAHNANPNKPTVIGTVSANVFRSNQQHYLAVAREPLTDWIDFDPFFGDQVTCDFTPDAEGRIPMGVTATFTAVPNTSRGGVFAGWYGDVPGGKCMDASITVHLRDKPNGMRPYIFARFTHPWALIDDGGSNVILDNGQFRIKGVVNGRNVSFARGTACSLYADDNTGSGVLDLGGMVTNVAGETYTIVNISR